MTFLAENIGTVIVLLVLTAIVVLVIAKMVKNKKNGISSCGCSCGCCPNASLCHKTAQTEHSND